MDRLKAAKIIFMFFFGIGTLLFLAQVITNELSLITLIGYYYLIVAIAVNCLIVLLLIISLTIEKEKTKSLKAIGVILLNVPLTLLYLSLVFNFIN